MNAPGILGDFYLIDCILENFSCKRNSEFFRTRYARRELVFSQNRGVDEVRDECQQVGLNIDNFRLSDPSVSKEHGECPLEFSASRSQRLEWAVV